MTKFLNDILYVINIFKTVEIFRFLVLSLWNLVCVLHSECTSIQTSLISYAYQPCQRMDAILNSMSLADSSGTLMSIVFLGSSRFDSVFYSWYLLSTLGQCKISYSLSLLKICSNTELLYILLLRSLMPIWFSFLLNNLIF